MILDIFRSLVFSSYFNMKSNKELLELARNGSSTKFIHELLSNDGYPGIDNKSLSNMINKLKIEEKKLKKNKRDVEKLAKFYNQQIKLPQKRQI